MRESILRANRRNQLLLPIVFAMLSIFVSSIHASTLTGTDLLKICDSASLRYIERWEKSKPLRGGEVGADFAGLCLGYVTGVVQTFTMLQRVCPSTGGGQVVHVIIPLLTARIADQPESGKWLAPLLILMAADAAYPCAEGQKPN
jgi:Rap1a immunity proteins